MADTDNSPSRSPFEDVHALLPMLFGGVQGQLVRLAAELDLAELLRDGPMELERLAAATGTDRTALGRTLRALARLGLLVEHRGQRYSCTGLGTLLRRDLPYTLHHYARMNNSDWIVRVAAQLPHSVRSGRDAFAEVHTSTCYEYLGRHAADAKVFNAALTELSRQDATVLLDHVAESAGTVVDVGGGQGLLLAVLLDANPGLHGVLLDLPEVVAGAHALLAKHVASGRCCIVGGDFRDGVPAGGDLYVLKRVVSTCAPTDVEKVLGRIRENIPPHGSLIVADPDPETLYGALFDVLMLVTTGGRLYPEGEMRTLLARAGFGDTTSCATPATLRVYKARPA